MTWLKIVIQTLTHLIGKKADKRDVEQLWRDTIPAPATASPGQTIVVKTVDDNGKPTEWEAGEAGGGLPEGAAPHQQLVTDADGVAMWEDKPFGEKMEEVVFVEKITFTPETPLVKLSAPFREINVGQVYHVMLDGERYDVEASYSTGILEISASNGVFKGKVSYGETALTIVALPAADSGYIGVEHTIEVLTTEKTIKTIDPKYLPGGGVVLYENYDGAPADGVIPCDISTYRYVEVLFVRNTGAGDVHSAVSGIVVGKSCDACANIWITTSPDVIGCVQIRLSYDESANCFSSTAGIYVEYNTTNGMSMTAGLDTYTFPARIVGYK